MVVCQWGHIMVSAERVAIVSLNENHIGIAHALTLQEMVVLSVSVVNVHKVSSALIIDGVLAGIIHIILI